MFQIYMLRGDVVRMKALLMRGANINFQTLRDGQTPLHLALENNISEKIVKFLLKAGANPHIEDKYGRDCCDLVASKPQYRKIKALSKKECHSNPSLRIKYSQGAEALSLLAPQTKKSPPKPKPAKSQIVLPTESALSESS